jgi:hypothetical protein
MFAIELDLFSIGTIAIPIHAKLVYKSTCIPYFNIIKHILKQLIEPVCVLVVNLIIPHDIVKHHLHETLSIQKWRR